MPATENSFKAYSNGMTLAGILDPLDPSMPDQYHPNKFGELTTLPEFLDGSIQRDAQAALRDCMNRRLEYLDISNEMRNETRAYPQEFIINCNMAYALSIPAPDWSDLYSYCKESTEHIQNYFPEFELLMREVFAYNLANTYAVFLCADYGVISYLKDDLKYTDKDIMRLAVLFDDDNILRKLISASPSPLTADPSVDQILASFVIDPFSAIRMSRAPETGITLGELYARTHNQICATENNPQANAGFMSESPSLQYRMAAEHRPKKISCPQTGITYLKPSTGILRDEDLAVPGIDHKLHTLPQFSDFVARFKVEISHLLTDFINSNVKGISNEGSTILGEIVRKLDQHGVSGKSLFLQTFSKLSPGQVAHMEMSNQFPQGEYLKSLLSFNKQHASKDKTSQSDFLVKAETAGVFKGLDLSDDELNTVYRIFGDPDFLGKMSDQAVERQLGVDLGL